MSGDEPSTWEKVKLNALDLVLSDSDEQFDETVRKPIEDKGQTDNWKLGLVVNTAQALVGLGMWLYFSGILAWLGAVGVILAVLAVVKWVIQG